MYRKNVAGQNIPLLLINSADGTALTGAAVTVYRCIDGAAQAAATGTVTEKANGQYNFAPSQADMNGNQIGFLFTAASAIPVNITVSTTAADPTDAAGFGLSRLDAAISSRPTAVQNRTEMDSNSAKLASIDSKTLNLPSDPADQSLIIAATDAIMTAVTAIPTSPLRPSTIIEGSLTLEQALRIMLAALAGKSASAGATITFRDQGDTKDRISAVVDENGNRSAITLDGA